MCYRCSRYEVSPMCPGWTTKRMVGASGFEPPTSWSRTRRASQAALRPEPCASSQSSLLGNANNGNTLNRSGTSLLGQTASYRGMVSAGILFAERIRVGQNSWRQLAHWKAHVAEIRGSAALSQGEDRCSTTNSAFQPKLRGGAQRDFAIVQLFWER